MTKGREKADWRVESAR